MIARIRGWPLLATGLLAAIAISAAGLCVTRIPHGRLGLVSTDVTDGQILKPGVHFHSPFARVHYIPSGTRRYAGSLRTTTVEGAAMRRPFEAEVDLGLASPSTLGALAAALGTGEPLDEAVGDAISAALQRASSGPAPSTGEGTTSAALSGLGLSRAGVTLGSSRPAAAGAHPIQRAYPGARHPVLVIGIDSADWDLIGPLMDAGRLPALKGLRDRGAWGTLRSMTPTLSPILWTTMATGRPPDEHGVIDFLMTDPATGSAVPISRHFRKVKALWNIATDFDLLSMTIGWWATWPAERVKGEMVTDRVAYTLFDVPVGQEEAGATWPPDLSQRISALRLAEEDVTLEDLREVADIPATHFERARAQLSTSEGYRDPVSHLIKVIAGTITYHRVAMDLLKGGASHQLALVYFEGLDEVNHRFAHHSPPAMGMTRDTPQELRESFAGAVEGFYGLQDRLVGELIAAVGPEANVLILSDHGFSNGAERPVEAPPDIEGQPGLWHTLDGIFIAAGPSIAPGRFEGNAQLLDVTPTVLALLGLPKAEDMPGVVLSGILAGAAGSPAMRMSVPSFDTIGEPLALGGSASSAADQEMIARLSALGYINSTDVTSTAGSGTATYHVNAGHIMLKKGDLDRARDEFERAKDLAPFFDQPLLGLAQVELMRKDPVAAIPFLEAALRLPGEDRRLLMTRSARVYVSAGRLREGLEFFQKLEVAERSEAHRHTAIGMLKESMEDADGAVEEYTHALRLDPAVERALRGLYEIHRRRGGDLDRLASTLSGSLDVEPARVAVRAANWLGLTREVQGRRPEARTILKKALLLNPSDIMTLTNLGSMFLRDGLVDEGLPYLQRAYDLRPRSLEVLVNLIVAHGRAGRLEEARRYYSEATSLARGTGMRPVYNAMAYACHLNGAEGEARALIEKSLAIDPNQEDVLRLQREIEQGGNP